MELRPYQRESIEGINKAFDRHDSTLLVLPTGCGKTIVFARLISQWCAEGKRVLVIAHRRELISQAFDKIRKTTDIRAWEMGIEIGGRKRAGADRKVIIGSVQTLSGARLKRWPHHHFDLIVVDEAHHAPAKSYGKIFEHFRVAKRLGVTATPDRLDGQGLGAAFRSLAYSYGIQQAIQDGYLVPIVGRMIVDKGIDLSKVKTTAGDFNRGQLSAIMESQGNLELVAKSTSDLAQDRPTIVFTSSVAQAENLAELFNALRAGSAASVDGKTDKTRRDRILRQFEAGQLQYLCNCSLFTEGVDVPSVACVAIARPTQSRGLYTQMVGRGTRLLGATFEESEANGKTDLLVLDFVGSTGRHKLVTSIDLFGGELTGEARKAATKKLEKGEPLPYQDALEIVREELDEAAARRSMEKVSYRVVSSDPFELLGVSRRGSSRGRPATVYQLRRLAKSKIPGAKKKLELFERGDLRPSENFSFEHAQEILSKIDERRKKGLCTVPMAKMLASKGLNPNCSYKVGKWAMGVLAKNKWRSTDDLQNHPELKLSERTSDATERI